MVYSSSFALHDALVMHGKVRLDSGRGVIGAR